MSSIIPKEQLSAYQRWELNSFDKGGNVALPTAEQIEGLHDQAHREGYAAGYQEGRSAALAEAQRLQQLVAEVEQELQQLEQHVAQDLLTLSLDIAKQVLRHTLQVKPELLLAVVRESISQLPHTNQHPHLILHPEDAELVRLHLGEQLAHSGWKIFEDAQLERGGCRLETSGSQIDATLQNRWQRVVAALGQDHGWLE